MQAGQTFLTGLPQHDLRVLALAQERLLRQRKLRGVQRDRRSEMNLQLVRRALRWGGR